VTYRYLQDDPQTIYLPAGFGNAFYTGDNQVEYLYFVTDTFATGKELTVRWDDPDLAIPWPLLAPPTISERDHRALSLRELFPHKFSPIKT
jgi:dTDP-4-dehydrorhamnose 3,5-epimerase